MRILLLAPLTPATGNLISTQRLQSHFETAGHTIILHSVHDPQSLDAVIKNNKIDALFGIHAYRAGCLLQTCSLPYGLLLTGPDIALFHTSPQHQKIMTVAIANARIVTTYHEYFKAQAQHIWPQYASNIVAVPKATTIESSSYSLRHSISIPSSATLFLHICGIRPVKDPLFLRAILTQWHTKNPDIHTVIIGQILDQEYAKKVLPLLRQTPGFTYHPPLPRPDFHAAIREADLVMNTALVEGVPNALLESMALGTPVIARNIPGNACFIQDNVTGMLFTTPKEFEEKASLLLTDASLRTAIIRHAKSDIRIHHTMEQERKAYQTQVLPHLCL